MNSRFLPTWMKSMRIEKPPPKDELNRQIFMLRLANVLGTISESIGLLFMIWFLLKLLGG
jgi:hypothetical protein